MQITLIEMDQAFEWIPASNLRWGPILIDQSYIYMEKSACSQ